MAQPCGAYMGRSSLQIRMRLRWWSLKRLPIIWEEVKCSRCCVLVVPGHPNPNLETGLGNFWAKRRWDEAEVGKKGRFKASHERFKHPGVDGGPRLCV
jgi:hypothetical protein